MRQIFAALLVSLALLLAGCATSRLETKSLIGDEPALAHLAWLAGSWASDSAGTRSEEHWTQPSAGTMFAVNRTMRGTKTVFFEFLRIEARADGIYFIAAPLGRFPPTEFRLTSHNDHRAVFENAEHDFPQRITYWRDGDTLHATAEGEVDRVMRSEVFQWQRARLGP